MTEDNKRPPSGEKPPAASSDAAPEPIELSVEDEVSEPIREPARESKKDKSPILAAERPGGMRADDRPRVKKASGLTAERSAGAFADRVKSIGWSSVMRFFGFVFATGALVAIGAVAYSASYLNKLSEDLPDYQVLADYAPPVTTRVYAGDGTLVAEFARERRLFVPIDAIPALVKDAFVSAEDKNFYMHDGLDMRGIIRAQISNIGNIMQGRRLEGGSTITQQVAKNFLLTSEQKLDRKLREWMVTRRMEQAYTKDQILELYLNEIYLGNRSYGVAAAALNYFDKPLSELTVPEAAYLAAIPKGPSNYHPVYNYDRAIERRNWVIGRLVEDGQISAEEGEAARATDLGAQLASPLGAQDWASAYFAEEVRKQIANRYGVEALYDGGLAVRTTLDPTLQTAAGEALRHWLVEYDMRHGWRGPLGEFDPSAVEVAEAETATTESSESDEGEPLPAWARGFAEYAKSLLSNRRIAEDLAPWRPALVRDVDNEKASIGFDDGTEGTIPLAQLSWARKYVETNQLGDEITSAASVLAKNQVVLAAPTEEEGIFALRQVPSVNGGMIAIDPHTGRVLAMVGGFSFELSEFNRAIQARRQPGSTFKPFVYSAALDSGYTPSSIVLDAPFVAPGVDSWWKPGNYAEGRFYGESTLRLGIEQSRNTMTARLAQDIGIGRLIDYAERFNLADRLPRELAISLGSGETTLDRITSAYSTFVNGGKRVEPFIIDRVQDRTGATIYKHDQRECIDCNAEHWMGQAEPQIADTREQVIDPRTAYQMVSMLEGVVRRGTGSAVRKVIDKPVAGKTGTTNEYKDAWFVGFSPDLAAGVYVGFDLPQTLGHGEAGGRVAAPIFGEFMGQALKEVPGIPFRVPSGVRLVRVNAKTGRPAGPSDANVILEAFKAEDVLQTGPTADDMALDPLSSSRPETYPAETGEEDLDGIY